MRSKHIHIHSSGQSSLGPHLEVTWSHTEMIVTSSLWKRECHIARATEGHCILKRDDEVKMICSLELEFESWLDHLLALILS